MPRYLRFDQLDTNDPNVVARLARLLGRPPATDPGDARLNLGLFDGSRLVGCVLASSGGTVRISELAVDAAYASERAELVARWCDLAARWCRHRPLEMQGDEPALQRWRALDAPLLADLGYRLDAVEPVSSGGSGPARFRSRWEAAAAVNLDPRALPVDAVYPVGEASYQVRVVRSETHWSRLAPYWDDLLRTTPSATGMQSFEYLRAWWTCFGLPYRLWILTIWRDGALCGIAPLRIEAERGFVGWLRELSFVGWSTEVDRPTFLFGGQADACLSVMLRFLADQGALWDRMTLYEQDADGPCARTLPAFATRGYLLRLTPSTRCPYVALNQPFERYMAARSRQFRKRLRAACRRLEAKGELRVRRVSDEAQVREAIGRFRDLEDRSWKRGTEAALGPLHGQFLDILHTWLGPKGALQVLELLVAGQPIASTIAFVHGRNYYSLHIVHDAAWADDTLGNVLTYFELEECHAKGYAEFDFLGTCVESKLHWTSSVRDTIDIVLTRSGPRERLVHLWKVHLAPAVRGALEQRGLLERMQSLQRRAWARLWGVPDL